MEDLCIPDKKCDKDNNWKLKKKEDKTYKKGKYGKVYDLCCGENCSYVLKFQSIDKFKKEYHNHIQVNKLLPGIAPKILDVRECEDGASIIMEKMDKTLYEVLEEIKNSDDDDFTKLKRKLEIQNKLKEMVKIMHYHGIIHNDLHGYNIMCKYINDKEMEWKFIDFGEAKAFNQYHNPFDLLSGINRDYDESINEIINQDDYKL